MFYTQHEVFVLYSVTILPHIFYLCLRTVAEHLLALLSPSSGSE